MASKIEQAIAELEDYIENCKFQMMSSTNIIVNKDEISELIMELKYKTPEEIKRYQKIISNTEAIMSDAKVKADEIVAHANKESDKLLADATAIKDKLVSEHEIMQQAYAQANEVVLNASKQAQELIDQAAAEAEELRNGAIAYTDEMLSNFQNILLKTLDESRSRFNAFDTAVTNYYEIIKSNRQELAIDNTPVDDAAFAENSEEPAEDDIDIDEIQIDIPII